MKKIVIEIGDSIYTALINLLSILPKGKVKMLKA